MTGTDVATTTGASTFSGADVDGLDKLSQDFSGAAQIVDEVKMACEVIVAVASFFGPFGASFVAYLKSTVIPWLTKISEALKLMSQVLGKHSQAQKDTSSVQSSPTANATPPAALPSYVSPGNFPATSTHDAPTPGDVTTPTGVGDGTTPAGTTPAGSDSPTTPGTAPDGTTPGATTSPGALPGGTGITTGDGSTQGYLTVPVTISPDGHISGLPGGLLPGGDGTTPGGDGTTPGGTLPGSTIPGGDTGGTTPGDIGTGDTGHGDCCACCSGVTPGGDRQIPGGAGDPAVPTHQEPVPTSGSGGGTGGGSGGGTGGGIGDTMPTYSPTIGSSAPTLAQPDASLAAAHQPGDAAPDLRGGGSNHDGLFSGIGQAAGIGGGAAALARAVLMEARRRADGGGGDGAASPFDSDSDGSAQSRVFDGAFS